MKKIVICLIVFIVSISVKAQFAKIETAFNNAITNNDYSSVMYFNFKDKVTIKKFNKWIAENGSSINSFLSGKIISDTKYYKTETSSEYMYGAKRTYLTKVNFLKSANVNQFAAYWQRQQELAEKRQQQNDVAAILGAGIALKLGWEGLKWLGRNLPVGDGSISNSSGTNTGKNNDSKIISKITVKYSKVDFCTKGIGSYKIYFYDDGKLLNHPSKLIDYYSIVTKDSEGKWWASCIEEFNSWEITRNVSFEEAVKMYWGKRWKDKYGDVNEFEFKIDN